MLRCVCGVYSSFLSVVDFFLVRASSFLFLSFYCPALLCCASYVLSPFCVFCVVKRQVDLDFRAFFFFCCARERGFNLLVSIFFYFFLMNM